MMQAYDISSDFLNPLMLLVVFGKHPRPLLLGLRIWACQFLRSVGHALLGHEHRSSEPDSGVCVSQAAQRHKKLLENADPPNRASVEQRSQAE